MEFTVIKFLEPRSVVARVHVAWCRTAAGEQIRENHTVINVDAETAEQAVDTLLADGVTEKGRASIDICRCTRGIGRH